MKIESLRLKNFKGFRELHLKSLPSFAVFVGANGTGKSSLFSVFEFLKEAMSSNVTTALAKLGGPRGFQEVRTRNSVGPIEIELQFKESPEKPLYTYILHVDEEQGRAIVAKEILKYRRGSGGQPWKFLDFSRGRGSAVANEVESNADVKLLVREEQVLKSPDLLAIKGLAQFEKFPAAVTLGSLLENWHISDIQISKARSENYQNSAQHLLKEGDNLSLVIQHLHKHYPDIFQKIIESMRHRVPGISKVEAKTTEEGRILLKFQDGAFEDPFLARFVSDGTIKMLAFLVLLNDPEPYSLLCVEEPENQLYPKLLTELAEEFRHYASKGSQVFVSTHSPDFLNACQLQEVFWFSKKNGTTQARRAADDKQIVEYFKMGDPLGALWDQGYLEGATQRFSI